MDGGKISEKQRWKMSMEEEGRKDNSDWKRRRSVDVEDRDVENGMHDDDHEGIRGCMDWTWELERTERRGWCGTSDRRTVDLRVSLRRGESIDSKAR